MSYMPDLIAEFQRIAAHFHQTPALQKVLSHDITKAHYISLFREIFHHTRENPQLQVLATVYFRGYQREAIKQFFRHATSEIGHDQLALNDIQTLGAKTEHIPYENPLPETTALLAYPFYQIYNQNPIGYLGYLFFLEFTPTTFGKEYMECFQTIGIPPEAMTFLHDHATVDVAHNQFMQQYVAQLVQSTQDYNTVVYAMQVTANLYASMISAAFRRVETGEHYGINELEFAYCQEQPSLEVPKKATID